jgi:hypothetical protein
MSEDRSQHESLDRLAQDLAECCRRDESPSARVCAERQPELAGKIEQARAILAERDSERPPAPVLPERLGEFLLEGKLGQGGMGEVFKAFHPGLQRRVALKRLPVERPQASALARFRDEAVALARLRHPHIVQVYDFTELDGWPILVMEYIEGGSLEERLDKGSALLPSESAQLTAVLARAMQHAHQRNIVHRDLKPANVLLDAPVEGSPDNVLGGFPKVADFGLAALLDAAQRQTRTGDLLGTPHYMAPEQAAGHSAAIGPPTDVWALGVILYRCLCGRVPFQGESFLDTLQRIRTSPLTPLRELRPDVPEGLAALCARCLDKEPQRRPTAAQLAEQLTAWADEQATLSPPAPHTAGCATILLPPSKPAEGKRSWRTWGAAAVLLVAGVLSAVAWFAGRQEPREPGREEPNRPTVAEEVDPLRLMRFDVAYVANATSRADRKELLGVDRFETIYNEAVSLDVELSRPAHCYLIALNVDGKDQVLWPTVADDPDHKGDPQRAPLRVRRLEYPPPSARGTANGFYLNDDRAGGTQGMVLVASEAPLPPYRHWQAQRGAAPWPKGVLGHGVWRYADEGVWRMQPGGRRERGQVKPLPGQEPPPVEQVGRWARGGATVVEVIAFPVHREIER